MMKWRGITEEEREAIVESLPGGIDGFLKGWGWQQFAQAIEAKLREKNTPPEDDEAEFAVMGDDEFCAGACGPREQALAEARHYALQYLPEHDVVRIEEVRRYVAERFTRESTD